MLFRRTRKKCTYDRENLKPVIRASICTGEQVAGFKNIHTGIFSDVMLIRNSSDFREFLEIYDISEADIATEYETLHLKSAWAAGFRDENRRP